MTGNSCDLNCAHCGGQYLKNMIPVEKAAEEIARQGSTSCLLSGGCSKQGSVSIKLDSLKPALEGLKVNAHVGLITEEEIQAIYREVDVVSFDFLVDDLTIKEVYHLDKTGDDYIRTYQMLKRYTKVVPHICIGLKGGEIRGEYQALDQLAKLGLDRLVFIIFIPTKGTIYADRKPPKLEEVVNIMAYARIMFPTIPIHLGCMRPRGRYRAEIDYYAVETGLNKLVNPTPPAIKRAKELGLQIINTEDCCVF